MNDEVLQNLAIATQFLVNARYAGTPRQAVSDGYSAMDAAFSALLVARSVKLPRNHKQKLDQVQAAYPDLLDAQVTRSGKSFSYSVGVSWNDVHRFYKEWLRARYERFEMPPGDARDRVMQAGRTVKFSIGAVAKVLGKPFDEVRDLVDARAFGSTDCRLYEALSAAHDRVFDEAERYGEEHGNRLAIKMGAATNFADIDLLAGDDLTREIIRNDDEIASECFRLHM
ncbi:MAG: hypothetical protein AAF709_06750 [Pseudomonadota bacterium]